MTGPEHYQAAESLLQQLQKAQASMAGNSPSAEKVAAVMAEAQVHATLALAAATAMSAPVADELAGFTTEEFDAWYKAAGTRPGGASDGR